MNNIERTKKILYIRSAPYILDFNNYNLQEVGLGTAFCKMGFNFDIVYYSKKNRDQVIQIGNKKLTILWRRGFKLLRTGIYPSVWKKSFLNQYDAVIVSEYSQVMSVVIVRKHKNVYLYNGPYYNLFKLPFMEKIYDKLFCHEINSKMKKVFTKTKMAKDYIAQKGITNCVVTGVGLDMRKFDNEKIVEPETEKLLGQMDGHRNLLYVGSIISRKNVVLLVKAFCILKKEPEYGDVQLVLVGKGNQSYTRYCESLIPEKLTKDVIWCRYIKNAQMKFVYEKADIFILPSVQEIFGMVLLEAMYFGKAVISSHSAGANTLIEKGKSGIIIDEFNEQIWKEKIQSILNNDELRKTLGENAHKRIATQFTWDAIAKKMLEEMKV